MKELAFIEASDANARTKIVQDLLTDNIGSYAHPKGSDYTTARATNLDNLDATISSRAAAATVGAYAHFPSGTYPIKKSNTKKVGILGDYNSIFGLSFPISGGNPRSSTTVNNGTWFEIGSVTTDFMIFSTSFTHIDDTSPPDGDLAISYDLGVGSPPTVFLSRSYATTGQDTDNADQQLGKHGDSFTIPYPIEFNANDRIWVRAASDSNTISGTICVSYMEK